MKLVTVETASHWYYADGRPCHEVPMKTDKNRMRDTNLSDARQLGLRPSVSNVIRSLAAPQLEAYKIEKAIIAALTIDPIPDEALEDRVKRALRVSREEVDEARKRGTLCHKCVEDYLTTGTFRPHDDVWDIMSPFQSWFDANIVDIVFSEKTMVGAGYAGRADLGAHIRGEDGLWILDFKSRKPSQGKLRCYDEDGMQLGAYSMAFRRMNDMIEPVRVASVLINSETPSAPTLSKWKEEDQNRLSKAFLSLFETWKHIKNYDPEQVLK